jgi:hypothetical protein
MGLVATVPTPITQARGLGYLLAAGCPQSALLMVGAQACVETNAWGSQTGKGYNNANPGNVTPSAAQVANGIDYMTQGLNMKYISFGTDHTAGARAMLQWLSTHGLLSYAIANDLSGYMARLQATCYLGCIGLTDGTGHTVSATDYSNYQAGISSWMTKLASVVPQMPAWWDTIGAADIALVSVAALAAGVGAVALVRPEWLTGFVRALPGE